MKMKQLEKREISKLGHAVRVGAVMLLCGLPLWFCSCEKEIPGQGTGSGNVELQFILGSSSYDTDASESRSYGEPAPEPETVVVSVGDDGLCLYATLEPDRSATLRASETIPNNTLVMIAAYKNGTYEASAQYKVNGSSLVPTAGNGRGLEIAGNNTYTFVAYSINSTASLPAYSATVTIGANSDLLYGKSASTPVNAGSTKISIDLKHQFSQVTVRVVATPSTINGVGDATLSLSYAASLNVKEGTLTKGAAGTKPVFTFPSNSNTTEVNCMDPRVVYTNGETPFTISLGSIKLGTSTLTTPFSVTFNKTALLSGKKYTLRLTFSQAQFAASNIYWDGANQKLTFDKGAPTDATMKKQGVFFKFGSLVGISPAKTSGAASSGDAFLPGSTVIYVPGYNSGSQTWSWSRTYASGRGWSWGNIPYYDIAPTGTGDRYDDSVIKSAYNSLSNWQACKGDICQLIDANYRLPYSYEFGDGDIDSGWKILGSWLWNGFDRNSSANCTADGQYLIDAYVRHDKTGYCFPGSGLRDDTGELDQVRYCTGYWGGSALPNTDAYNFFFMEGGFGGWMITDDPSNRQIGRPIRCVKK